MTLPVTVVVPHRKSRDWFFRRFCLPSIEANGPAQIVVEDWEGGACEKRNAGARKASQPFIAFIDDDEILAKDFLSSMLEALYKDPGSGYAYCDFIGFVWPGVSVPGIDAGPDGASFPGTSREFDGEALKKENYIDTTAVIRRHLFHEFDPKIRRFQDWDLWLTLLLRFGVRGRYVPGPAFLKCFIDGGITASVHPAEARFDVLRKHGLA